MALMKELPAALPSQSQDPATQNEKKESLFSMIAKKANKLNKSKLSEIPEARVEETPRFEKETPRFQNPFSSKKPQEK